MSTFIQEVVSDLKKNEHDFSNLVFILPSRRAGTLLQKTIAYELTHTIFSPTVYSIEEFVHHVSGLESLSPLELTFKLYEVYLELTPEKEQESFQNFLSWAPALLDDINEIDRHLLNHAEIFEHLNAIQELDHWSKTAPTDLIKKYLLFWSKLPKYYSLLTQNLVSQGQGHQGLLYRKASEEIEFYIRNNGSQHHVFLGFNALNTSEEQIIQALLAHGNCSIYWDAERHFMNLPNHNASVFLTKHKSNWKHFATNEYKWISSNFNSKKELRCTAVPQNIDQVKYVSKLLASLDTIALNNTAVVLGDESIIIPLLNSLPANVQKVNITMGVSLDQTPITSFFENLFTLQLAHTSKGYYHKHIHTVLNHPLSAVVFSPETIALITKYITSQNHIYLPFKELLKKSTEADTNPLDLVFFPWKDDIGPALQNTSRLIALLLERISYKEDALLMEYLQGFKRAFNQLQMLCTNYSYIKDIKVLERFYRDIVSKEVIDLRGNPHEGLQVMGMLESRLLDFDTVIITSVNEGVLPSGKSSGSYIPYDLKRHYGLPTYLEKDAVYTYHFYRLLHRATTVDILYTTSSSGLGSSEKSRLILQLEAEGVHKIKHQVASAPVFQAVRHRNSVIKTPSLQKKIQRYFESGISPSAIGTYLRNPLDFYYQYILGVSPPNKVEETIASNTMGTIIHNVLERLYLPYKGRPILLEDLQKLLRQSKAAVDQEFQKEGSYIKLQGKNLIIYEVICRFIDNVLKMEIASLRSGASLEIHSLENKLKASLTHPNLPYAVSLKGTVDRVDFFNGVMRIIDYKTGTVEPRNLKINNWEDLLAPEGKYEKSFQVLLYTYMLHKTNPLPETITAGIISTKKIQHGYMPFTMGRDTSINQETLTHFEGILVQLIQEIINPDIPFEDSGFSY